MHHCVLAQVDLPALLGVDLVHCERQAAAAVNAGGGALRSVQGELITQGYFDGLAAEIDELLQARRRLPRGAVGAQSRRHAAREGSGAGVLLSGHACRATSMWHVHVPHGKAAGTAFLPYQQGQAQDRCSCPSSRGRSESLSAGALALCWTHNTDLATSMGW
jgi:hypothetical protein